MRSLEWIEDRCEKIPWSGCWIWMGATQNDYGSFRDKWKERTKAAHRAAYEAANGPLPLEMWALHRCDIRQCCNPDHLFAGTRRVNIDDAVAKGRLKGLRRKFDDNQARELAARHINGESFACIAREFGVSFTAVRNAVIRYHEKTS